jgi:CPA1 family monovalent cation:H+ antiporter
VVALSSGECGLAVRLWHIVAVVGIGVAVGILEPGRWEFALGQATLYVFLPPLLFEAAWSLDYRAIVRQWRPIAILAVPGVLLTAFVIAGALAMVGVPFGIALLTGSILSATDPIAVVAIFRRLRVPKTLATVVECESLFNDAVSVTLYRIALAFLAVSVVHPETLLGIAGAAIGGALGGIALGIALAWCVARLLQRRCNASIQVSATVLCAYGAYFAADAVHLSGIFATIACGIAVRFFERRWVTLTIAQDVVRFWDLAALVENVLVFFLVGAALRLGEVAQEPIFALTCVFGIVLSRVAVAWLLLPARYPPGWLAVVRVAGMRGALSLALAIALPASVPYRNAIVHATFAVAIVTLAVSALTTQRVVLRIQRAS